MNNLSKKEIKLRAEYNDIRARIMVLKDKGFHLDVQLEQQKLDKIEKLLEDYETN